MKKLLMSMKVVENPNYVEVSNIVAFDYINFFEKLGFLALLVPNNSKNVAEYLDIDDIELLVLIGGNNVNPKLYGGEEKLSDIYPIRDRAEELLIDRAIEKHIPIIGICRGFQMLNVYFNGSITHKINNHVRTPHKLLSDSSILTNKITNTFHNQGVTRINLSNDLTVLAEAEDGYIEAFNHKQLPILGLQWHPERQDEEFDRILIENFLKDNI